MEFEFDPIDFQPIRGYLCFANTNIFIVRGPTFCAFTMGWIRWLEYLMVIMKEWLVTVIGALVSDP